MRHDAVYSVVVVVNIAILMAMCLDVVHSTVSGDIVDSVDTPRINSTVQLLPGT